MPKLYFYDTALACHLLRLTNPEDVFQHYLKGGLFESMILSNLLKNRYHNALPPNVYFWRDKLGNEVDCILEEGLKTKAIEIKSTETINSDLFNGLNNWSHLTGAQDNTLIYAGTENQTRSQGTVLSWKDI